MSKLRGQSTGTNCEIDYIKIMPVLYGYRYLIVLIDNFASWIEMFLMKTEAPTVVAEKLLEDIIHRYRLYSLLCSDSETAFTSRKIVSC